MMYNALGSIVDKLLAARLFSKSKCNLNKL